MSITKSNLTVNLTNEELEKLESLVEFFQSKSIARVTKSDVIKFLITRTYEVSKDKDIEKIIAFYETLGINVDFQVE